MNEPTESDDLRATVAQALARVRARIRAAEGRPGRAKGLPPVSLLAVSKRHPVEAIRAAYAAGQRAFGENYAQELVSKHEALSRGGDDGVEGLQLRMIGRVQRNKVGPLVEAGAAIDTVDSRRLLERIGNLSARARRRTAIRVQVNVAGEAQKGGCSVAELPALVEAAREIESIELEGLLFIAPLGDPESSRPHFRRVAELSRDLALPGASMGMSADLEVAIEEGAAVVRVGTAIFGARPG